MPTKRSTPTRCAISSPAADQPRRHHASPRDRAAARKLQMPRRSSRWRGRPMSRSSSPSMRPIRRSPISAPISSMRGCNARREEEPDGYSPAALDRWAEVAQGLGGGGEPGRARLCQRRAGARRARATSSPSSSAATRCATRSPPRACAGGWDERAALRFADRRQRARAASRPPIARRSPRRSGGRTRRSSPGGWCRRRAAASWCGCSARCCARRRRRSAGWSAGKAARSSRKGSARSRR